MRALLLMSTCLLALNSSPTAFGAQRYSRRIRDQDETYDDRKRTAKITMEPWDIITERQDGGSGIHFGYKLPENSYAVFTFSSHGKNIVNPHASFEPEAIQSLRAVHRPQRQLKKVLRKKRKRFLPTRVPYKNDFNPDSNFQPNNFQNPLLPQHHFQRPAPPQHEGHQFQPEPTPHRFPNSAGSGFSQIEENFDFPSNIQNGLENEGNRIHTNLGNGNFIRHKRPAGFEDSGEKDLDGPPSFNNFDNSFNSPGSGFADSTSQVHKPPKFSFRKPIKAPSSTSFNDEDAYEQPPSFNFNNPKPFKPSPPEPTRFPSFPTSDSNNKKRQTFQDTFKGRQGAESSKPSEPFTAFGRFTEDSSSEIPNANLYSDFSNSDEFEVPNFSNQLQKLNSFKPTFVPSQIVADSEENKFGRRGHDTADYPRNVALDSKETYFSMSRPGDSSSDDKTKSRHNAPIYTLTKPGLIESLGNDRSFESDDSFEGRWNTHDYYPADEPMSMENEEDLEEGDSFEFIGSRRSQIQRQGRKQNLDVAPPLEEKAREKLVMPRFSTKKMLTKEPQMEARTFEVESDEDAEEKKFFDLYGRQMLEVESLRTNKAEKLNRHANSAIDILSLVKQGLMKDGMVLDIHRSSCPSRWQSNRYAKEFAKCSHILPECEKKATRSDAKKLEKYGKCLVEKYPNVGDISGASYQKRAEAKRIRNEFENDDRCTDFVKVFFKHCQAHIPSCALLKMNQEKALPMLGCLFVRYPDLMNPLLRSN